MAKIIVFVCFLCCNIFAFYHDFDVIALGDCYDEIDDKQVTFEQKSKCNDKRKGKTIVVFGGIQGDEPGGFHAASILAQEYKFYDNVTIVPNLAYESILLRGRGMYGDLNRKFANLNKSDGDYERIQKIKKIILQEDVDFIINLHDGSGFYAKTFINKNINPNKWGNACIIDQENIDTLNGDLYFLSTKAMENINKNLLKPHHRYDIKNTNTKDGDKEMLKALTYFAITHKKAAVANEASKDLPTHERAYYHLLAVEGYLNALGVRFERNFELTSKNVFDKINQDFHIKIGDFIYFPVNNLRPYINYFPFDDKYLQGYFADIKKQSPLLSLYKQKNTPKNQLLLQYGNRLKSTFRTFNIEYADKFYDFDMIIDGKEVNIQTSDIYKIRNEFIIKPKDGFRFNVIGFVKNGVVDESGIKITKNQIQKSFSIDKNGRIFRLEIYKNQGNKEVFSGMVLLEFLKD